VRAITVNERLKVTSRFTPSRHQVDTASEQLVAESLEVGPFGKQLFSSDAWGPGRAALSWRIAVAPGTLGRSRPLDPVGRLEPDERAPRDLAHRARQCPAALSNLAAAAFVGRRVSAHLTRIAGRRGCAVAQHPVIHVVLSVNLPLLFCSPAARSSRSSPTSLKITAPTAR